MCFFVRGVHHGKKVDRPKKNDFSKCRSSVPPNCGNTAPFRQCSKVDSPRSNFTRFTCRSSGCGCCCRTSGTKGMGQNKGKKGLVMMDSFLVGICCWKRGIRGYGYATPTLLFFYESWPSPSPKKAKFMKQFSSVSRNPINETPLVPIGIPISHGNPIPQPRGKMLGFASGVRKANLRNGLKFPTKKTRFVGFPFTVVTTRILSVLVTFIYHNFGEGGQPGQPKV